MESSLAWLSAPFPYTPPTWPPKGTNVPRAHQQKQQYMETNRPCKTPHNEKAQQKRDATQTQSTDAPQISTCNWGRPWRLVVQSMEGDLRATDGDLLWLDFPPPPGSLQARPTDTLSQPSQAARAPMKGANLAITFSPGT